MAEAELKAHEAPVAVAKISTIDTPCTGCGARNDELVCTGQEHEYDNTTTEPFNVVRCRDCGQVRLNPRPTVDELGRIYPPNYYAYHLAEDDVTPSGIKKLTQRVKVRMYQRRLSAVLNRAGFTAPKLRVLDVGCADGRLLSWYKDGPDGHRLETHGIDISEEAVEAARKRGHHAVAGRFETDSELEPNSYHLILAGHVIEHVDDPRRFAERAFELLVPGGLFIVATPNYDSIDVRWFGKNWGGSHFPRHWTFYDPRSIERLAAQTGFEVSRIDYQVNPVFWNWTAHSLLRSRFPGARWPDRVFPTVRIFHPSLQSFVLLSLFTTVDASMRAVTGRTASMSVELRKPVSTP